MFFESVKAAWEAGTVRIGIPAAGYGARVTIEARGLIGVKAMLLTRNERQALAALAKNSGRMLVRNKSNLLKGRLG